MHLHLFLAAIAHGVGIRLYVELRETWGDFRNGTQRCWTGAATTGALIGALALARQQQPGSAPLDSLAGKA